MKYCLLFILLLLLAGCHGETKSNFGSAISKETLTIKSGKAIFEQHCAHCHNFNQDAIGPNLSGLTQSVETEWIKRFIKNPFQMVAENDERAKALHQEYKIYMPGFGDFSENEMDALLSYVHTYEDNHALTEHNAEYSVKDPIKDTLRYSTLTAKIEFVAQVPASNGKPALARINKLDCIGDSRRIFVNDLRGMLYELKNDIPALYLSIPDENENFVHEPGLGTGFGSFAFHPDFEKNGLFYTAHSEKNGKHKADFFLPDTIPKALQWVITEWNATNREQQYFKGTNRELLRIDFVSTMHGVQEIAFNPTAGKNDKDYGMLYIGVGEGGCAVEGYPQVALHQGTEIWGTILRIDPMGGSSENGKYGIPNDNPFAKIGNKRKEIWAYGFRNPNRLTWNSEGKLFASDIGHKITEEVNLVEPGKFYGWPIREGDYMLNPFGNQSLAFPLPENDDDFGVTYPVVQYDHDDGLAISGGFFARKKPFQEKYIFGDIPTGTVFIADLLTTGRRNMEILNLVHRGKKIDFARLTGHNRIDLRFGQDCDGKIYLLTKADGKIYSMVQE